MPLKLRYLARSSVLLNLSLTVIVSSFALQVQISQAARLPVFVAEDVFEMEYGVLLSKQCLESMQTLEELYQFVLSKQ